jgi:hypothetical protein
VKIYDLLLRQPPGQPRWADRPGEAVDRLEAELAVQRQVDAEPEALRTLA